LLKRYHAKGRCRALEKKKALKGAGRVFNRRNRTGLKGEMGKKKGHRKGPKGGGVTGNRGRRERELGHAIFAKHCGNKEEKTNKGGGKKDVGKVSGIAKLTWWPSVPDVVEAGKNRVTKKEGNDEKRGNPKNPFIQNKARPRSNSIVCKTKGEKQSGIELGIGREGERKPTQKRNGRGFLEVQNQENQRKSSWKKEQWEERLK